MPAAAALQVAPPAAVDTVPQLPATPSNHRLQHSTTSHSERSRTPSPTTDANGGGSTPIPAAASMPHSMRRIASAPALRATCSNSAAAAGPTPRCCACHVAAPAAPPSGAACSCLEVYVVSRAFTEFGSALFKHMTPDMKRSLIDLGLCHYMTVFRTPEGKYVQFDFGPVGGDVEMENGPLANVLRTARRQQQQAQQQQQAEGPHGMKLSPSAPALELCAALAAAEGEEASSGSGSGSGSMSEVSEERQPGRAMVKRETNGEIREKELDELPLAHMYVGRTNLTLDDVRLYNSGRAKRYKLHENDCRHYVNQLVQYATGMEHSTQHLKRHHFRARHNGDTPWHGWFIEAGQFATDIGNWSKIQAGGAAAMLAITGRMTLVHLKALAAIAHAKGVGVGVGGGAFLQGIPLPLPPLMPLLRSAQLHMSSALAAAASAGAPLPGAAAGVGGGSAVVAGGTGAAAGFGGFGAFAQLLLAPTAIVAAGMRRPLASGAVAAAGAGAGAVALGGAAGADGGAGRQATMALRGVQAGGGAGAGARGAVARVREQLGKGIMGAALALQRVTVGAGGGGGSGWVSQQRANRRMAVVAGAAGGGGAAGTGSAAAQGGVFGGFSAFGASVARMWRGAQRRGGAGGAAVQASAAAAATLQPAQPVLTQAHASATAAASAAVCLGHSVCSDGALVEIQGAGGDQGRGSHRRMHKSASCGSIIDLGGSRSDVSSIQYGGSGGRQTLHLPSPRLSWLQRHRNNSSNALVLRGA